MNSTIFSRFLRALHRRKLKQKIWKIYWFSMSLYEFKSSLCSPCNQSTQRRRKTYCCWVSSSPIKRAVYETCKYDVNHHGWSHHQGENQIHFLQCRKDEMDSSHHRCPKFSHVTKQQMSDVTTGLSFHPLDAEQIRYLWVTGIIQIGTAEAAYDFTLIEYKLHIDETPWTIFSTLVNLGHRVLWGLLGSCQLQKERSDWIPRCGMDGRSRYMNTGVFFSSGVADHALRLGPYMRISYYRENFNMDTGGRMRIGKSWPPNTKHHNQRARRRSPSQICVSPSQDSEANSERGKSPTKTTTEDLPRTQYTGVVHRTTTLNTGVVHLLHRGCTP